MILNVVAIAVLVLSLFIIWTDSWYDFVEKVFFSIITALAVFVVWLIVVLFVSNITPHDFTYTNRELSTINDGTKVNGSFFLGSGIIDEKQVYSYYYKDGGASILDNAPANEVRVYEDGGKYLVQQTECIPKWKWLVSGCVTDERVTEIHIPENSIKQNFVLDAQ